jgi:hypothetical protein
MTDIDKDEEFQKIEDTIRLMMKYNLKEVDLK